MRPPHPLYARVRPCGGAEVGTCRAMRARRAEERPRARAAALGIGSEQQWCIDIVGSLTAAAYQRTHCNDIHSTLRPLVHVDDASETCGRFANGPVPH